MERTEEQNAFDLLRYAAALSVMYLHLTGYTRDVILTHASAIRALRAVVDFFPATVILFSVSGFLAAASLERTGGDVRLFLKKRFFRIYPDLWLSMAVYLVVLALFERSRFDRSILPWILLQGAGFAHTPRCFREFATGSINGPLWYLTVLIQLYILLALVFKRLRAWSKTGQLCLFLVCVLLNPAVQWLTGDGTGIAAKLAERSVFPYAAWFLTGVFFRLWKGYRAGWFRGVFAALLVIYAVLRATGVPDYGYYTGLWTGLCTALLAVMAAYVLPPVRIRPDLTYGMYLYHWLFLNLMIRYGFRGRYHWVTELLGFTLLSVAAAFVFRVGLWKRVGVTGRGSRKPPQY